MGLFKKLDRGFKKFEHNIKKDSKKAGKFIKKHGLEIGLGAAIIGGAALTLVSGGAFAPVEAELIGAEVVAVGAIEVAGAVGAEAAVAGAVGAEVAGAGAIEMGAVGIGAELSGAAAAAEAVTADVGIGAAVAAEDVVSASAAEALAPIADEGLLSQGLGAVEGTVGKIAPIIKSGAALAGLGSTIASVVIGSEERDEEQKLSEKISGFGKILEKTTDFIEQVSDRDLSAIKDLTGQIGQVSEVVGQVEETVEQVQESVTKETEEVRHLEKDIEDMAQEEKQQQIDEQLFESKILSRVENEEKELVAVIDDLAERLQESNLKPFKKSSDMINMIEQLEQDDIVGFMSRNIGDFNKFSKSDKNKIIDLIILKGL